MSRDMERQRDQLENLLGRLDAKQITEVIRMARRMLVERTFRIASPHPPAFKRFAVRSNQGLVAIARPGDTVVAKYVSRVGELPVTARAAERIRLLETWLLMDDGGAWVWPVRLVRQGRHRMRFEYWSDRTGAPERAWLWRHVFADWALYEPIEIQPGADQSWRDDRPFAEAVERLG